MLGLSSVEKTRQDKKTPEGKILVNRLHQAIALGLASGGLLLASALPAAAQPGGPCTLASDDVVTAALGVPARAVESIAIPGLVSCGVRSAADDAECSVVHLTATPDAPVADSLPMRGAA